MFDEPTVLPGGHVSFGKDSSAYVRFYKYSHKGKQQDFIEIIFPGDTRTEMRRPVQEEDKTRWRAVWESYERGEQSKAEGYPLEQWREMDEGMIRELNHKHIYTVEQLAAVTDANLQNVGLGSRILVDKARAFIATVNNTEAATKYAAQFEAMKADYDLLAGVNKELAAKVKALEAYITKRMTKEPKVTEAAPLEG